MNDTEQTLPCADKLAFDSKHDAQGAATTAAHRHGVKLKPYLCRYCQLWHLATDHDK